MKIFDIEYWREIISVLKANKFRSTLTAFGVFWGIMMFVVMKGSGKGLENGVYHGYENFAKNSAFLWSQKTSEAYGGFLRSRNWNITDSDIKQLVNKIDEIQLISPRIEADYLSYTNNTSYQQKKGTFSIVGDHPNYVRIEPTKILFGRFLNDLDLKEKRKVCVIGIEVYKQLFKKDENPIGKRIKVVNTYFTVIGVTTPGAADEDGSKKKMILFPISTIQSILNIGDRIDYFGVLAKPKVSISDIETKIINTLKKNHKISLTDKQAVGHYNIEKQFKKLSNLFNGINVLTWIVGIGTLIAGIFGISNVMLLIVKERTKEIGIKRAFGATPSNIKLQIINESIVLTILAGYVGLAVGISILSILNNVTEIINKGSSNIFFRSPEISPSLALISLLMLVIAGAFAGLLPAHKAIQVKPIEAIRDE